MTKNDDQGELASLALHMGYVMGALHRPEVIDLLMYRSVDGKQIDAAKAALNKIAQAFYRQD